MTHIDDVEDIIDRSCRLYKESIVNLYGQFHALFALMMKGVDVFEGKNFKKYYFPTCEAAGKCSCKHLTCEANMNSDCKFYRTHAGIYRSDYFVYSVVHQFVASIDRIVSLTTSRHAIPSSLFEMMKRKHKNWVENSQDVLMIVRKMLLVAQEDPDAMYLYRIYKSVVEEKSKTVVNFENTIIVDTPTDEWFNNMMNYYLDGYFLKELGMHFECGLRWENRHSVMMAAELIGDQRMIDLSKKS